MPGLEIRNLTASFPDSRGRPVPVLDDLSLEIPEGLLVSIIGPIGSGKTTLLRTIAGLHPPDRGEILWNDSPLPADLKSRSRHVSHLPCDTALFPHLSVAENLGLALDWRKLPTQEKRKAMDSVIACFELEPLLPQKPDALSSGQRQTAGLARSFASTTPLLLLDEPLSNCDRLSRFRILQKIRNLSRENGTTLIMVTHHQEEAFALDGRMVVMRAGTIEECNSAEKLYHQPQSPFTAHFVGRHPMNLIKGRIRHEDGHWCFLPEGGEPPIIVEPANEPEGEPHADHPVVLGIRCDDIEIQPTPGDAHGVCSESRFLGNGWMIQVQTPQKVEVLSRSVFPEGTRVSLKFSPRHLVIFPPEPS